MSNSTFFVHLSVDHLAISIRNNDNIKGINMSEEGIKISQLADDTTCFLSDINSAKHLLNVLRDFENAQD